MGERRADLRRNQLQRRERAAIAANPHCMKKSPEESRHALVLRAQSPEGVLREVVSTAFAREPSRKLTGIQTDNAPAVCTA